MRSALVTTAMWGVALLAPLAVLAQVPEDFGVVPSWHHVHGTPADGSARAGSPLHARIEAARAELALGRPARARLIISHDTIAGGDAAVLEVLADIALAERDASGAAALFERAADLTEGRARGLLLARAGGAREEMGDRDGARRAFRRASELLGPIRGWIAIREARLAESAVRAFEILRLAPPAARSLAAVVRADIYLAHRDSTKALHALEVAGARIRGARLADALGDTARARVLVFAALQADDTSESRAAARWILDRFTLADAREHVALARVVRSYDMARAAALFRAAVTAGDSSAATLRQVGDADAALGRPSTALVAYSAAAARPGSEAALAEYLRARLLIRTGQSSSGYRELEAYARTHHEAPQAPLAGYLVAERALRNARPAEAESLLTWVAERWPNHSYGSRARIQAAALALRQRNTSQALTWYRREIELNGEERFAARFFMAQTRAAIGDSVGARRDLVRLATQDSLGYYGTVARTLADMPTMQISVASPPPPRPQLAAAFEQLDLLSAAGLLREAETLVQYLTEHLVESDELLEFAEGLSERGFVVEGIRLGWRIVAQRSLHDARVLRVVYPYPWPARTLIEQEAREHGVDPYLLAAVVRQESAFRVAVTSRAGARGLMQLMPSTAVQIASRLGVEWTNEWLAVADANLHLGAAHLAALMDQYQRLEPALAAYNAGGTPVARWLRYPDASDPYRFIEQIPYGETRGYVRAVLRNHSLYRALYPPTVAPIDNP